MADEYRARWDKLHRSEKAKKEPYEFTPRNQTENIFVRADVLSKKVEPEKFERRMATKEEIIEQLRLHDFEISPRHSITQKDESGIREALIQYVKGLPAFKFDDPDDFSNVRFNWDRETSSISEIVFHR